MYQPIETTHGIALVTLPAVPNALQAKVYRELLVEQVKASPYQSKALRGPLLKQLTPILTDIAQVLVPPLNIDEVDDRALEKLFLGTATELSQLDQLLGYEVGVEPDKRPPEEIITSGDALLDLVADSFLVSESLELAKNFDPATLARVLKQMRDRQNAKEVIRKRYEESDLKLYEQLMGNGHLDRN